MATQNINQDMHFVDNLFDEDALEQVPTRNGYGKGLVEAGKQNDNVVVLCADLTGSTRSKYFKDEFPDRFVQIGVSEQSMASIAAGMAITGKVPFISSYAAFSPGRNWEQTRTCIALQDSNVKIGGAHAGVSVGPDGATHQMIEDIAIMRVMPNMRVLVPCDMEQTKKATTAAAEIDGPVYVRFARAATPVFTTPETPFEFGKAQTFREGSDLTIIGAGPLMHEALKAAKKLSEEDGLEVRVVNIHTVKPLDQEAVIAAADETGAVVTVEEAQAAGGLGSAVAETLADSTPTPLERVGIQDRFGESGDPQDVLEGLGLTAKYIRMAAKRVHKRKQGEDVPTTPKYVSEAKKNQATMKKEIMEEALNRAPKKWGGDKPNDSLKSRK
jgi:transketolase